MKDLLKVTAQKLLVQILYKKIMGRTAQHDVKPTRK